MVQQFAFRDKICLAAGCHGLDSQSDEQLALKYIGKSRKRFNGSKTIVFLIFLPARLSSQWETQTYENL